jgi:hypothetical protein
MAAMRRFGILAALSLLALPAPAHGAHSLLMAQREAESNFATGQAAAPRVKGGPCTKAAARAMPDASGAHDHSKIAQHRFRCRMKQVFFDSLEDELSAREDVVLGEMDVKRGLAIVGVTFPEAGFLLFDVRNPAKPKFLSWYRTSECDQLYADVNCGAFVDLSARGDVAFLSIQTLTIVPGAPPRPGLNPVSTPSVEIVDIRDRRNPTRLDVYPVVSEGGVHTTRSHVIPENPRDDGPREPGEYLFSIANGVGIDIARVERSGDVVYLEQVNTLMLSAWHDTFIENDPIDHRTYLYIAGGFETGFQVYDVTDPYSPTPVANWDLTPECFEDWYAHTIDVTYRRKRRYVTLPAEMFEAGEQAEEDQAAGCGKVVGNGDKVGPLWIVDASNWSKLGKLNYTGEGESDSGETLAGKSRQTLLATWTNPAGRAGGNLMFSPHNQQIVGNRIYLSHYHGGVYVLDAKAVFSGKRKAPVEAGFIVPSGRGERPLFKRTIEPVSPFFTDHLGWRPDIWDAYWYRGHVLAADMVGGFYSLRWAGEPKRRR